jgi:ribosomal protein S18 acetylase RimI-like enzyme
MEVHVLDELAINATAASINQIVDGWLLRASPHLPFQRCNCAIALRGAGPVPVDEIERFYDRRPARVQVTTVAPATDEVLRDCGYEIESPVDVVVASTAAVVAAYEPNPAITTAVHAQIDEEFAQTYAALHDNERVLAYWRMMQAIAPAMRMVTAMIDGEPVGMAYGVVERRWCGVYGVATLTHARRQGVATTVMHALARAVDAGNFYLQVERDNAPAHALYDKTFAYAYGYHYRVKGE